MKKAIMLCVALAVTGATETSAETFTPKSTQGVPATKLKKQCDEKGGIFAKFVGHYACQFPANAFGYSTTIHCNNGNPPRCSEWRLGGRNQGRSQNGGNVRVD